MSTFNFCVKNKLTQVYALVVLIMPLLLTSTTYAQDPIDVSFGESAFNNGLTWTITDISMEGSRYRFHLETQYMVPNTLKPGLKTITMEHTSQPIGEFEFMKIVNQYGFGLDSRSLVGIELKTARNLEGTHGTDSADYAADALVVLALNEGRYVKPGPEAVSKIYRRLVFALVDFKIPYLSDIDTQSRNEAIFEIFEHPMGASVSRDDRIKHRRKVFERFTHDVSSEGKSIGVEMQVITPEAFENAGGALPMSYQEAFFAKLTKSNERTAHLMFLPGSKKVIFSETLDLQTFEETYSPTLSSPTFQCQQSFVQ